MSDRARADEPVAVADDAATDDSLDGPLDGATERSELEQQRDDYLDSLQRLQADFENYRKRVTRSSDDAAVRATGDLVAHLLPVIDALDLAVAHFATSESDETLALVQARALLIDSLAKQGLERIDALNVGFDPQIHDAVVHVAGDGDDEQVIDEVLRAGYRWKGAVMRPAMVRVKG